MADNQKKFHLSPMIPLIFGVVVAVVCVVVMVVARNNGMADETFYNASAEVKAECVEATIYTSNENGTAQEHYNLLLTYSYRNRDYEALIDETTPTLKGVDIGDTVMVRCLREDPQICRTSDSIPSQISLYITCLVILLAGLLIAALNLRTILRNLHPVYQKLEQEDMELYAGDGTAAPGQDHLSDTSIDYAAGDTFSDRLMDTFSDPFATYTGYEEEGAGTPSAETPAFDPNRGYSAPSPDEAMPDYGDINSPFATAPTGPLDPRTTFDPNRGYGDPVPDDAMPDYGDINSPFPTSTSPYPYDPTNRFGHNS